LHFHLFLFLLLPPPPTSTLFPYTTLFRSLCGPNELGGHRPIENPHSLLNGSGNRSTFHGRGVAGPEEVVLSSETCTDSRRLRCRSEEHTSELQSRGHLVCRLLLEKKKRKD